MPYPRTPEEHVEALQQELRDKVKFAAEQQARIAELEAQLAEARKNLDAEIDAIDKDERYHYEPASVQVNAPLALIQVNLGARMAALQQIRATLDAAQGEE